MSTKNCAPRLDGIAFVSNGEQVTPRINLPQIEQREVIALPSPHKQLTLWKDAAQQIREILHAQVNEDYIING